MTTSTAIVCMKCGRVMVQVMQDVRLLAIHAGREVALVTSNLYECQECGQRVATDMPEHPYAFDFENMWGRELATWQKLKRQSPERTGIIIFETERKA